MTLSVLKFVPTIEDDGKYLTCRAENPAIADSTIEDKWLLNVECKLLSAPLHAARSGFIPLISSLHPHYSLSFSLSPSAYPPPG